jgi:hypothetical protein
VSFNCSTDDTITVVADSTANFGAFSGTAAANYLSIYRLSGPSVIAATETVAASYVNSSGQSTTSGAVPIVTGWTKETDSHSFFNPSTGIATIPVSGRYSIAAQVLFNGNATGSRFLMIYKNSSLFREFLLPGSVNLTAMSIYANSISLLMGETIDIRVSQSSGGALTLNTSAQENTFSIVRVGNY